MHYFQVSDSLSLPSDCLHDELFTIYNTIDFSPLMLQSSPTIAMVQRFFATNQRSLLYLLLDHFSAFLVIYSINYPFLVYSNVYLNKYENLCVRSSRENQLLVTKYHWNEKLLNKQYYKEICVNRKHN